MHDRRELIVASFRLSSNSTTYDSHLLLNDIRGARKTLVLQ